jgi:antitoxin (DNA-binding transcriptional repressor) of toxin-antitoxin stability system
LILGPSEPTVLTKESLRAVGLKTLKNKLSEYVRLAASGETVLVTDRHRVVAEIGPPSPTRSSVLSDALLFDAVRQGWMTPPISVGRGPPPRQPVLTSQPPPCK